jgi:hypothetical protein
MFENLKVRLHSIRISRRKQDKRVFVNPYATATPDPKSKISPYMSEYGSKKRVSITDLFAERLKEKEQDVADGKKDVSPLLIKQPPFTHDMKEIIISDILYLASILHLPTKRKEKDLTMDEIVKICDDLKW